MEVHEVLTSGLAGVVALLAFLGKRVLSSYDDSIKDLTTHVKESTELFRTTVAEFQKELSQIRMESALIKQASAEYSRYAERLSALERQQVVADSKLKAAFAILTGKRKAWDDEADQD